jgi:hypothetical protein
MRDVAVVGGVLGLGCVVVFALAATVAVLFPNGTMVTMNPWGAMNVRGGVFLDAPVAMPAVEPAILEVPVDEAEK